MIAIIDYGMGNIHSVQKALQLFGAATLVTNKPEEIKICNKIVLPGVGAFDDAMLEFKKQKLALVLKEHIQNKKLFLGICLGMQLLFDESQESKLSTPGLGIIKGNVKRFNKKNIKVPHIGWNQLKNINDKCPLLQDIQDGAYVYFCHSFYPDPEDKSSIASTCDYGIDFTSVIWKDNVYGMQFHPEKSQSVGLKMLKNFVEL